MKHIDSITLWHYMVGDASPEETARIKKHLSNCKNCMKEYELLHQIETALYVADEDAVSFGFSDAVIRKIENETVLERNSIFSPKFLRYTILSGFALAILSAIMMGVGLDSNLSQLEGILNSQIGILILTACGILWGLYFIDRICKKIFGLIDYA